MMREQIDRVRILYRIYSEEYPEDSKPLPARVEIFDEVWGPPLL